MATSVTLILLFIANLCFAETKNDIYQVEIIAFAYTPQAPVKDHNEIYPSYPALPDYNNSQPLNLEPQSADFKLDQILDKSLLQLNREENLISKKDEYQILFHYGWLQKAGEEKKLLINTETNGEFSLKGTIKVHKGYYYIADINLELIKLNSPKEHIVFKIRRKLKSKEMNYIDHPKLGLLIEIFPKM